MDEAEPVLPHVSRRMSRTRGRDTKPEVAVRRALHARGYRFRINYAPLPDKRRRTADIAFTGPKLLVMIDGCFWHMCPIHYVEPKTRTDFWAAKIQANVARDRDSTRLFNEAGWTVLRFWEHESVSHVVEQIVLTLSATPHK